MSGDGVVAGACNICGGRDFGEGPNGRLSATGLPPRCSGCGCLERHRQLRRVYACLPRDYLGGLTVLQLSPDPGVEPHWFERYEVSVFGGENSLDLQAIDRPDGSYGLVICNHVLEHIPDDRAGFRELLRVAGPRGLVQITVPSPHTRATTEDWGYPRARSHGHYRNYGRDLTGHFLACAPGVHLVEVLSTDPATGTTGHVYLWTRDAGLAARLRRWIPAPMQATA